MKKTKIKILDSYPRVDGKDLIMLVDFTRDGERADLCFCTSEAYCEINGQRLMFGTTTVVEVIDVLRKRNVGYDKDVVALYQKCRDAEYQRFLEANQRSEDFHRMFHVEHFNQIR